MVGHEIKLLEQLIDAIMENDLHRTKQLLQQGANPNGFLDAAKVRPLHYAAQNGSIKIAKLLVLAGAKMHVHTEPDRETPLDIALLHSHTDLVELLLLRLQKTEGMATT